MREISNIFSMQIEVSTGEVVDKWTILNIKAMKIAEQIKFSHIVKERSYLGMIIPKEIIEDPLTEELQWLNKQLWDVEDKLRECEKVKIFDDYFVQLARSVYLLNDKRAHIKKQINMKYFSEFIEEKSYQPY